MHSTYVHPLHHSLNSMLLANLFMIRQEGETFPIIVTDDVMQDNWSHVERSTLGFVVVGAKKKSLSVARSWNLLHLVAWKKLKQNKMHIWVFPKIVVPPNHPF